MLNRFGCFCAFVFTAVLVLGCDEGDDSGPTVYSLASFDGVWIRSEGIPQEYYLISDGAGTITDTALMDSRGLPASYTVTAFGSISIQLSGASSIYGRFTSSNYIQDDYNLFYSLSKVSDLSRCAGAWSGTLREDGDMANYPVTFTVDSSGAISTFSGLPGPVDGYAFEPDQGSAVVKIHTGASGGYSEVRLMGSRNGDTLTLSYIGASGSGILGTATLTR